MALTKAKASNILLTTPAASSNDTTPATTAYVTTALANLVDSAPSTLNTLNELAAALGDDANFSTTVTNSIAAKLPLAGGTLTGDLDINANLQVGDGNNINMDASSNGQVEITGSGYTGAIALDDTAMRIYHNSSGRDLILGVNETEVMRLNASKQVGIDMSPSGYGKLSVNGTGILLALRASSGGGRLGFFEGGAGRFYLDSLNGSDGLAFIDGDGTSERMRITSNGNVGIGGNASPAQALEVYRNSSSGSAGGYAGLSLRNDNSSGYMALQFHEGGTLHGDILFQNGTNDMQFRVGGGGTERMRIRSGGNVSINMGSNTTAMDQHKLIVNTDATNGTVGSQGFVHFGPISGTSGANSDGYLSGISLGYHENSSNYKHTAIAVRAHGDNAARRDMLFLVNTASEAASAELSDAKITISSGNGKVTIGNTSGISDYYVLKVLTTNGHGSQGSHNSSYYHHDTDRLYYYFNKRCEASGGFHTYSDERLKEEITPVTGALDSVAKMNGVTFKWKNADERGGGFAGKHFGVTAQNMLEVDPELPELNKDPLYNIKEDVKEDDEYYTMDYSRLSPFFIEAIKELKEKLEAAEARITELEG